MDIVSTLKNLNMAEFFKNREMTEKPSPPPLVFDVENARIEWQQAIQEMNHSDYDLAEHIIFKINAAERRYMALLEQARKEGVKAWPTEVDFIPAVDNCAGNGAIEVENEPIFTG